MKMNRDAIHARIRYDLNKHYKKIRRRKGKWEFLDHIYNDWYVLGDNQKVCEMIYTGRYERRYC